MSDSFDIILFKGIHINQLTQKSWQWPCGATAHMKKNGQLKIHAFMHVERLQINVQK